MVSSELQKRYAALWQEVAWLHAEWTSYVELFGKESRVKLLNSVAPVCFRTIQETLWETILLHIARLIEPDTVKGKAVLTIVSFPRLIPDSDKTRIPRLVEDAKSEGKFCTDWRNRYIAHRNLALALREKKAKPLLPTSRKKVREAIAAIDAVMCAVSLHWMNGGVRFDLKEIEREGYNLMYVLTGGLKAMQERRQRMARGEMRPEDTTAPEL